MNLLIQGEGKEQRRDLNGDDVDPNLAGKGDLLGLRSISFILILPGLSMFPQLVFRLTDTKSIMGEEKVNEKEEEEEEERGQWSNPCDFFISCLGYAVGLGHLFLKAQKNYDFLQAISGGFPSSVSSTAVAPFLFPTSSCLF